MGKAKSANVGCQAKTAVQLDAFEKRHREAAKIVAAELAHRKTDKRLLVGWKGLMGLKNPNCNVTSAHVALLPMLARELVVNFHRHGVISGTEPIGIIEVVDERWDASSITATIDGEAVRKHSRAMLKKLLGKTSFTAMHQVRPLTAQPHSDGGMVIESRVLAIVAGQAVLTRAKAEAPLLSQQMTSRMRRGDAITVREFGTRKRDLTAAVIEMLSPAEVASSDPVNSELDLRMLQVRAMLLLKQSCFGIGKAQAATAAALKHVELEAKRFSKGSKGGVHRDGVAQFLAELNTAIGRPEWRSPLVKSRK